MSNLLICLQTTKDHFQYIWKDRSCSASLTEWAVWSACVHGKGRAKREAAPPGHVASRAAPDDKVSILINVYITNIF